MAHSVKHGKLSRCFWLSTGRHTYGRDLEKNVMDLQRFGARSCAVGETGNLD